MPYETGEHNFPGSLLTPEEIEFGHAMEEYRRRRHRRFLACSEILAVLKSLGYERTGPATELPRYHERD